MSKRFHSFGCLVRAIKAIASMARCLFAHWWAERTLLPCPSNSIKCNLISNYTCLLSDAIHLQMAAVVMANWRYKLIKVLTFNYYYYSVIDR